MNQTGTVQVALGSGEVGTVCVLTASASITLHDIDSTGAVANANQIAFLTTPAAGGLQDFNVYLGVTYTRGLVLVAGAARVSLDYI